MFAGVAVRPHHEPAGLVEGDRGPDLLPAVDHPAREEVAHVPGLGGGERVRTHVGDRERVLARAPLGDPPAIAEVPVQVGADRGRARGRLAVLPPEVEVAARDVGLGPVRVHREDDPDLPGVDDVRDPGVVTDVAVDEPVHDPEGHLETHVLVGVGQPVEQDLGLVLVDGDVVRDLDRPHVPALVGLADREPLDDSPGGPPRRRRRRRHLGIGVVALPALREVGRDRRRRDGERGQRAEEDDEEAGEAGRPGGASRSGHALRMTARGDWRQPGPSTGPRPVGAARAGGHPSAAPARLAPTSRGALAGRRHRPNCPEVPDR